MIKKKEILHKFINFVCVRLHGLLKVLSLLNGGSIFFFGRLYLNHYILLAVSIISHIFPSTRIHTDDTSPSAKDQHVLEFQIAMI